MTSLHANASTEALCSEMFLDIVVETNYRVIFKERPLMDVYENEGRGVRPQQFSFLEIVAPEQPLGTIKKFTYTY